MSDNLKNALQKAFYKTVVWFVVFQILDYFVEESTYIDAIKDLGLISWFLLFSVFSISHLIQSKFSKD